FSTRPANPPWPPITNLPFHASGSQTEKLISLPMTPSSLHSGTGEVAAAALVILTSGAMNPLSDSHATCACAVPAPIAAARTASAIPGLKRTSLMKSSRGSKVPERTCHTRRAASTHAGQAFLHKAIMLEVANGRYYAASGRRSPAGTRPLVPGLHAMLQARGGVRA